jgi:SAM-dependent methyltransferase
MKVLDLASGAGEPALDLAVRVGPQGEVTSYDPSPELLEIARQRAIRRGVRNLVTRLGYAERLPFADNSFDLATCRFGIMFFADCGKALGELLRVLKPGARACFVAWGRFEQPYWQSTMGVVHAHVGGPLLAPPMSNLFAFAEPGSLAKILASSGFARAEDEARVVPWDWPGSAEELWAYAQAVSTPFLPLVERIPRAKRGEIEREVLCSVERYRAGLAIRFQAQVVFASGQKTIPRPQPAEHAPRLER